MLVALVSAKGAPGVTTASLCLTAAAEPSDRALLAEADPAGGDLECWCGPTAEPGLVGMATELMRDAPVDQLRGHAVEVVPGVTAVTAPTGEAAASAVLGSAGERLGPALAAVEGTVFLDCGRWSPAQPAAGRVAAASLVVVVCRPTLHSVEHARATIESLRPVNPAFAVLVVGGVRPYGPDEIGQALQTPVIGSFPWEPTAVAGLVDHGIGDRSWLRSPLATAAGTLLGRVYRAAQEAWADV